MIRVCRVRSSARCFVTTHIQAPRRSWHWPGAAEFSMWRRCAIGDGHGCSPRNRQARRCSAPPAQSRDSVVLHAGVDPLVVQIAVENVRSQRKTLIGAGTSPSMSGPHMGQEQQKSCVRPCRMPLPTTSTAVWFARLRGAGVRPATRPLFKPLLHAAAGKAARRSTIRPPPAAHLPADRRSSAA